MSSTENVDKYGIRLAPTPLNGAETKELEPVVQPYQIVAKLNGDKDKNGNNSKESTLDDFQPKAEDIRKKWKRTKRTRNFFAGLLMFIASAVTILPFLLGYFEVNVDLPFKYSFVGDFNIIKSLEVGIKSLIGGATVMNTVLYMIPSIVICIGFLAVIRNLIVSVVSMCGVIKPQKYFGSVAVFVISVVAIIVASLVGVGSLGISKIDPMVLSGAGEMEEITTMVFLVYINIVFSIIAKFVGPNGSGY